LIRFVQLRRGDSCASTVRVIVPWQLSQTATRVTWGHRDGGPIGLDDCSCEVDAS